MPNMDGMEAAEMIMKEMSIPIVLSTGRTDDATLQRARKADIHSYLVKPFHREQLKTAITMAHGAPPARSSPPRRRSPSCKAS